MQQTLHPACFTFEQALLTVKILCPFLNWPWDLDYATDPSPLKVVPLGRPCSLSKFRSIFSIDRLNFFLRALGYSSNSVLKMIDQSASSSDLLVPKDKRGRHKPKHAMADDVVNKIDEHIERFHPAISHYRRKHAPHRRYLSPDITIRDMHSFFKEEYPNKW